MTEEYGYAYLMGIKFINITENRFLEEVVYPKLEHQEKCFIVTANPEFVIATRDSPEFKAIVESADYVLPDGVGIIHAANFTGQRLVERVTGVDVMYHMLEHANANGYSVFFLGATEDANKKAVEKAKKQFPDLVVAGRRNGYFNRLDPEVSDYIASTEPDIIFAALGMQRQEEWIHESMGKFNKGVFIGVGGSLDVLSGNVSRAPDFWINLQLEWLYRLMKQPSRFKRDLKVFEFMLLHTPVIKRIMKWFGFSKSKPRQTRDHIK